MNIIFAFIALIVSIIGIDARKDGLVGTIGICMLLLCIFALIYTEKEAEIKVLNQETKVDTLIRSNGGEWEEPLIEVEE